MGEYRGQVVIKPITSSFKVAFCGQNKDAAGILSRFNLNTPVSCHEYLSDGAGFFLVIICMDWDGIIKDSVIEALDWNRSECREISIVLSN